MDINAFIIEMRSDETDRAINRIAQDVIEAGLGRGGRCAWHYIGEEEASEIIKDGLNHLLRYLLNLQVAAPERPLKAQVIKFIKQAEFCGYECIGGWLKNNQDFVDLKAMVTKELSKCGS